MLGHEEFQCVYYWKKGRQTSTMRIIFLSPFHTLLIDIAAWIALHFGLGYLCNRIPIQKFNSNWRFFKSFVWEKNGAIYEKLFRVRSWKHLIPQGSRVYRDSFSLQHLKTSSPAYVSLWIKESIRAEFCHWIMIIPGFFFSLWNSMTGEFWIMVYALVTNLVPIIMQRFNRPRFRILLDRTQVQPYLYESLT